MKLHASGEDYLEAVLILQKQKGMVRSVDVARHMGVSKPSVCHAVATLRDGGFLTMDEDYLLHLTDVGREAAEQIYEKHRFFRRALTRTTTNFKDRQVLRRQHLPVPLCTFRGTHVPNHANVRVVDLHSLPRMFGPLHILLMHHDFLNEQPQQFRRQFLDVGVAPGF